LREGENLALEIFKLVGSIFVNSDEADKSMAKTEKKAQGIGSTLLKGVGTAAKWGVGIVGAAGAGVAALGGLASKVADTTGAIQDSADRAGVTAESYQKYAYAAKMSGIETNKLDALMIKSQKTFADAKTGSDKAGEAYSKLGVDISKIGNSSDAFDATIAALASMEDETQRNALANDIFGKSYADLAPLLNEGTNGIAALKKEAVDMGAVMSNEAVAAGEKFGDTIDKVKSVGAGLFNSLGTSLIPIIQTFADLLLTNTPMIQQMFASLAPVITTLFSNLLPPIMDLVNMLLPTFLSLMQTLLPPLTQILSEVLPIVIELLNMLLPPIMEIVQALLPPLLEIILALTPILQTVIDLLKPILDLFMGLLRPILDLITTAIAPLITQFAGLINTVLKPIIPIIQMLGGILTNVLGAAFEALGPYIDNVMGYLKGLIDFITGVFTGNWKLAFEGLKSVVKNIFEGMVNLVKAPINVIIKGINAFIGGLNKLKIPDWVPEVGGKGINIPEIPLLAKGGTVTRGGRAIVGEAGAELLDLPAGARVTPLNGSHMADGEVVSLLAKMLEFFAEYFPEFLVALQNNGIILDGEKVNKKLAPGMSKELASLNKSGSRRIGVVPG
jgi:hypothetical protein